MAVGTYSGIYDSKKTAERYDRTISNPFEAMIFEGEKRILKRILKRIGSKNTQYLDFACGTGRIIQFVAKETNFKSYTGADLSKEMIALAKKKMPHITFKQINILEDAIKPIGGQSIVTCFRLILNLEDDLRQRILSKLREALVPGGYLIVNNHMNRWSVLGLTAFILHKVFGFPLKGRQKRQGQRTIINTLTERQVRKILQKSGFTVKKVHRFAVLPGHKKFRFPLEVELFLSRIPIIRWFSKDQIFVCKNE